MRGTRDQFRIMIEFMERNGDISRPIPGAQGLMENHKKWLELVDLLNDKTKGGRKPLEKWRKTWSDFKSTTKKKLEKLKKQGGVGPGISDLERRVLKLIKNTGNRKKRSTDSEDNGFNIKQEIMVGISDEPISPLPIPSVFCTENKRETPDRRISSASTHSSSSANSDPPPKKRRKQDRDYIRDITDRYLEFEREREKMLHEREMARLKQNEQVISIMGRIVNVLETIAPNIKNYVGLDKNGDCSSFNNFPRNL